MINRRDKYDAPAPTIEDLIRYEKDNESLVALKLEVVLYTYWQWWPYGHKMQYNRAWGWRPGYHLRWGYWGFRFQSRFSAWPIHKGMATEEIET